MDKYPNDYLEVSKYYEDIFKSNFMQKSFEQITKFFIIIQDHEHFLFNYTYEENNKDIYNLNDIYNSYCEEIDKSQRNFIKDLIYFVRNGWVKIFIPKNNIRYFIKSDENITTLFDEISQLNIIEDICEIYKIIKNNENVGATIYFTYNGDRLYKIKVGPFLLKKMKEAQNQLKIDQKQLNDKINNYNIQIITIVSITISIVTFIAVNIKELGNAPLNFLLIDGSLIVCITTIFFIIGIIFFEPNKKYWFLLIPLAIGTILIYISLYYL